MGFNRYANTVGNSIKAVLTMTGEGWGLLGPRFSVQKNDDSFNEMPLSQLALFLNDTTGKNSNNIRSISEDIEKKIVSDFKEVLEYKDGKYHYKGSLLNNGYDNFFPSYMDQQLLINYVKTKLVNNSEANFVPKEVKAVCPHEVALTNTHSDKPILASFGAGSCIIAAGYNSASGKAVLAHIDSLTDLKSLKYQFDKLSDGKIALQIHLTGGYSLYKKLAIDIINTLKDYKGAEITSSELCSSDYGSKKLAIDARTGEIFTNFDLECLGDKGELTKNLDSFASLILSGNGGSTPLKQVFEDFKNSEIKVSGLADEYDL
jgi:hypothetical protein